MTPVSALHSANALSISLPEDSIRQRSSRNIDWNSILNLMYHEPSRKLGKDMCEERRVEEMIDR